MQKRYPFVALALNNDGVLMKTEFTQENEKRNKERSAYARNSKNVNNEITDINKYFDIVK